MSATAITVIERATVERINEEHRACERASGEALAHALEAGRLLAEVKSQLRHGEFGPWIEEHFDGSARTAQTYMQIANAPAEKRNAVAELPSLRQARDTIAKPKTPSASDTIGLLRNLGGGSENASPSTAVEPAPAEELWTAQLERKLTKALGHLRESEERAEGARRDGLASFAIAEGLRAASIEARYAYAALEELAFSFER